MTKRVQPKLDETGQGKYMANIGFTFAEVTELIRALHKSVTLERANAKDKTKTAEQHELAGYRQEILSRSTSYLYEAHKILKEANTARQQGRWEAKKKVTTAASPDSDTTTKAEKNANNPS